MKFDLIWLVLRIAAAGYFIGYGLIKFNNPKAKSSSEIFDEEEHELITEDDVHDFMGISKEDAKYLIKEHPDVPHIIINNKVYYPRVKLREWLESPGENSNDS